MATKITTLSLKKVGNKISAGFSATAKESDTIQLQFPAARSAGNDGNITQLNVTDLYKNGLLFSAFDYPSRTTPGETSLRAKAINALTTSSLGNINNVSPKTAVANILLPRSKVDVDEITHKFNDVGESVITRGNGTLAGALSNVASTALFGMIESVTSGVMADHNEQIYTTARSMYGGANNRTKTYRWELTPRSVQDLVEILKIYKTFAYYSYGTTGNSKFAKTVKSAIDNAYNKTLKATNKDAAKDYDSIMSDVTSFLTNVIVVSNPTIWFVNNFGDSTSYDRNDDVFGPCQIQSIRFDKAPSGDFNGLAVAPNMSNSYVLEVTMREILTLSRTSLGYEVATQ